MLIRMRTLAAGPSGVFMPSQEYDVPASEAKSLVAGGYAEAVHNGGIEYGEQETAMLDKTSETMMRPRARAKRG